MVSVWISPISFTDSKDQEQLAKTLGIETGQVTSLKQDFLDMGPPYRLYYRLATVTEELGLMELVKEREETSA